MSARPRPVTATVTKPEWMKAEYAYRPYSHSLDSTGSTESLISCLDHDSYESSADDEQEILARKPPQEEHPCKQAMVTSVKTEDNSWCRKKASRKIANSEVASESLLSPWEKWLVEKAQEDRRLKQEALAKKQEEKRQREIQEQEKQAALQKAKQKQDDWLRKKDYETKIRIKLEKQQLERQKHIEESKKKQIEAKSEEKFKEWQLKKRQEERLRKRMEKEKKEEEERKRKERKEMAEKKFTEWCKRADTRPKSSQSCHGEKGGDYPAPSFYNPLPWQPIPTPRYKDEQKKPKSKPKKKKYVWNPNKYL